MTPPAASTARAARTAPSPRVRAPRPVANPRRPAPAPERLRHLEVVRGGSAPGRRPPRPVAVAIMVAAGLALLALVTANVFLGQAGITESKLQRAVAKKQIQVDELALEVARLGSPVRIAARAAGLGMVPATDVTVLVPNARSTVRGPSPIRGRP